MVAAEAVDAVDSVVIVVAASVVAASVVAVVDLEVVVADLVAVAVTVVVVAAEVADLVAAVAVDPLHLSLLLIRARCKSSRVQKSLSELRT